MNSIDLIVAERQRQIAKGYDANHDDEHRDGEIAMAAASYAATTSTNSNVYGDLLWPFSGGAPDASGDPLTLLAKAGALIVAEMERLQRASFVCAGCKRRVPNEFGAADDMPDHCDDCWEAAHPLDDEEIAR